MTEETKPFAEYFEVMGPECESMQTMVGEETEAKSCNRFGGVEVG